ncbi:MAG: hypothetical protein NTY48_01920, partial [Candidatus Diapherotrites archaeon]|nr:hypothetical protein [Candidatus Diapherotrites archaeon]
MGSLNETRITRRIRKQTRKEPRSAEHFERMYLLLKERNQKLRGGAVAFSRGVAITQAKEIMAFVGMNRGRGVHVFCPLKLGLHVGEFLKGFFKYAAPEARVTLLITPKADVIGYDTEAEKSKRGFALIGGEDWTSKLISNVRNHLQKSARSTDTKLVFFDDHAFGRTRWLIEQAIE